MSNSGFQASVYDFQRFIAKCGYPDHLLWTNSAAHRIWLRRCVIFVADQESLRRQAEASFAFGVSLKLGLSLEALCKTESITICGLYVPRNEADAHDRMISSSTVKLSALTKPLPVWLIRNRVLWWLLKRLSSNSYLQEDQ